MIGHCRCYGPRTGLNLDREFVLQRAQNAAARLVAQLGPRDHVSNALRDLHWLPVHSKGSPTSSAYLCISSIMIGPQYT